YCPNASSSPASPTSTYEGRTRLRESSRNVSAVKGYRNFWPPQTSQLRRSGNHAIIDRTWPSVAGSSSIVSAVRTGGRRRRHGRLPATLMEDVVAVDGRATGLADEQRKLSAVV